MMKKYLKNRKFIYCWDNIRLVCEAYGDYDCEYFASNPDDPDFIIIETPAKYCGDNDSGEEVWEIEGKKYNVVPYISTKPFIRRPKGLPGEIIDVTNCLEAFKHVEGL